MVDDINDREGGRVRISVALPAFVVGAVISAGLAVVLGASQSPSAYRDVHLIQPGALRLVSKTTWNAASDSGNVLVEPNRNYLVRYQFEQSSVVADDIRLTFNDGSGVHSWAWHSVIMFEESFGTPQGDGARIDSSMKLAGHTHFELGTGEFFLNTHPLGDLDAIVDGQNVSRRQPGAFKYVVQFGGTVDLEETLSHFRLVLGGLTDGTLWLYELAD